MYKPTQPHGSILGKNAGAKHFNGNIWEVGATTGTLTHKALRNTPTVGPGRTLQITVGDSAALARRKAKVPGSAALTHVRKYRAFGQFRAKSPRKLAGSAPLNHGASGALTPSAPPRNLIKTNGH